jgi:hypothetical protein
MLARSRSEPVISARPSTRKMMWAALAENHLGLVEDLRRNVLLVVDTMPPVSISSKAAALVFGKPMDAVARDAGLIADNRAPLSL